MDGQKSRTKNADFTKYYYASMLCCTTQAYNDLDHLTPLWFVKLWKPVVPWPWEYLSESEVMFVHILLCPARLKSQLKRICTVFLLQLQQCELRKWGPPHWPNLVSQPWLVWQMRCEHCSWFIRPRYLLKTTITNSDTQVYQAPMLTHLDLGEKVCGAMKLREYRGCFDEQYVPAYPIQFSNGLQQLTMLPDYCRRDLPYNAQNLTKLSLSDYSEICVSNIPLLNRFSLLRKLRILSYCLQESDKESILVPFCTLSRYIQFLKPLLSVYAMPANLYLSRPLKDCMGCKCKHDFTQHWSWTCLMIMIGTIYINIFIKSSSWVPLCHMWAMSRGRHAGLHALGKHCFTWGQPQHNVFILPQYVNLNLKRPASYSCQLLFADWKACKFEQTPFSIRKPFIIQMIRCRMLQLRRPHWQVWQVWGSQLLTRVILEVKILFGKVYSSSFSTVAVMIVSYCVWSSFMNMIKSWFWLILNCMFCKKFLPAQI